MRKLISAIVALLLAIVIPQQARASDGVQYFVIRTAAETVLVALADNPVVTYANNLLVITTAEKQVEVPVPDITEYYFTAEEPSGIKAIKAGPLMRHGMVAFDHLKAGASVMLYNVKGELLCTAAAQPDGTAAIDMNGLAKGIYIIRSGKLSFKIINN